MIKTNTIQIMEQALERFQQGGFINGDYVTIKKIIISSPYFKDLPSQSQDYINNCLSSDLRMRVSAIKSIRPAIQPVDGGMNAGGGFVVDIVVEYAPGLYKNPLSIPAEFLQLVASGSEGFGTLDVPDSLKRKDKVHGPEADLKKQMLPLKNTKLPNANKHPDDQPGGVKKGLYMKDHKAGKRITEEQKIWEAYEDSWMKGDRTAAERMKDLDAGEDKWIDSDRKPSERIKDLNAGGKVVNKGISNEEVYKKLYKLFGEHPELKYKDIPKAIINNLPPINEWPQALQDRVGTNKQKDLMEKKGQKLDPVGEEDGDVNNDNKEDETDEYLLARRKKISKAIKSKKSSKSS